MSHNPNKSNQVDPISDLKLNEIESSNTSEFQKQNDNEFSRLLNQSFNQFLKINEKKQQNKTSGSAGLTLPKGKEDSNTSKTICKSLDLKEEEQQKKLKSQLNQSLAKKPTDKFKQSAVNISNCDIEKKFLQQFENLSAACGQMYEGLDEKEFAAQLKEMEELGKKLEDQKIQLENQKLSDDIESIWTNLMKNSSTQQDELEKTVETETFAMENMFFDMFYYGMKPLFAQLKEKLPIWIEKNRNELSDSDHERYNRQVKLVELMCKEMNSHQEGQQTDQLVQKMHDITQELEKLGNLPKEVLGLEDLPMFKPQFNNPTFGQEIPKDCLLM